MFLDVLHDERQEVARLLERVGAMRNQNAIGARIGERRVDAFRQLQPDLVVHVLAADARHLLAGEDRQLVQIGDRLEERVDVVGAGFVPVITGAGLCPRDGAAGGEHPNAWQRSRLLRRDRRGRHHHCDDRRET